VRAHSLLPIIPAVFALLATACSNTPVAAETETETETETGEPVELSCLDTDTPGDDIVINFDSAIDELALGECVPERLLITGGGVTDLSGLAHLREVGVLEIRFTPQLESLAGLDQLERIGTLIITGNAKLTSLPSFAVLDRVSTIRITGNDILDDLGSFPALTTLRNLEISSNPLLTDFSGFEALTSTTGFVELWDATLVPDLSGFEALASVGGDLRIETMPALTSLAGLGVSSVGGNLRIVSNVKLDECLIDDFVAEVDVGGATIISGNKSGFCG